jgi:catechol 2,3-dioxygenase-like lactoylglutathione lyase family enzyme
LQLQKWRADTCIGELDYKIWSPDGCRWEGAPGCVIGEHEDNVMERFRFEGLTLTVESVERSIEYYGGKLGLAVEVNAAPAFAMIRVGAGTIGLLSLAEASKEGVEATSPAQKRAIHVEFSTDDLDGLYEELKSRGVVFHEPPHDEPWERAMTAFDPDGYAVEFAQGRRGQNQTKA